MAVTALEEDTRHLAAPTRTVIAPALTLLEPLSHSNDEQTLLDRDYVEHAKFLSFKYPDSPSALARLARAMLNQGDTVNATATATRVLDLLHQRANDDRPAALVASQVLLACGEIGRAETALAELATGSPGKSYAPAALLYALVAVNRNSLDTVLDRLGAVDTPQAFAVRGWVLIQQGKYQEAIRALRTSVESSPDPDALVNLGYAYAACGSYRKAIRRTLEACQLAPSDRTAGFNLAGMWFVTGALDNAQRVLNRLRKYHPQDLRIDFAAAEVDAESRGPDRALRRLLAVRSEQRFFGASPVHRSELKANVALLRLRTGELSRSATFMELVSELEASDYRSLPIANYLPVLARRRSEAAPLGRAYTGLQEHHPTDALLGIRTTLATLEGEIHDARALAILWTQKEPFSAPAYIAATYLLTAGERDYEQAVALGRPVLRRFPQAALLANNVAFALAMLGRLDDARRVLPDETMHPVAAPTAGLIEIAAGNIERGREHYENARRALGAGDSETEKLITRWQLATERYFGHAPDYAVPTLPTELEEDFRFRLLESAFGDGSKR